MIANELQYQITKEHVRKFQLEVKAAARRLKNHDSQRILLQAQVDALQGMAETLQGELTEYETLIPFTMTDEQYRACKAKIAQLERDKRAIPANVSGYLTAEHAASLQDQIDQLQADVTGYEAAQS